jgi:hypothetical protein
MLTGVRMGRYQMSAQDQDTEHPEYGTPYTLYREASVHVSPPLSISISGRDCLPYGLAANLIWSCLLWVVGSVGLFSLESTPLCSVVLIGSTRLRVEYKPEKQAQVHVRDMLGYVSSHRRNLQRILNLP